MDREFVPEELNYGPEKRLPKAKKNKCFCGEEKMYFGGKRKFCPACEEREIMKVTLELMRRNELRVKGLNKIISI